jgi:hypothetical protein
MAPDRPEVLTSLPRSRPTRRSAKRGAASEGETQATEAAKPKAKAPAKKAAPAKKKPATTAKAKAAKPAAKSAAKPAAKRAAKPAAKPKTAAKPKAKAAPKKRAALKEVSSSKKPEPVSTGAPGLDDFPKEPVSGPVDPPSGGELLQSAAKAAGEIAQAGITVGREALKSVAKRLPRP